MDNFFSAIGEGMNTVMNSVLKERDRAIKEMGEHVRQDADQIASGIDRGGFLGGLVEAADVFSPGHQVVGFLDAYNVIPEDRALQEGISAGVNLAAGAALTGPVGGVLQLISLKDAADALNASGGRSGPIQRPQSAPQPADALRGLGDLSRADAIVTIDGSGSSRTGFRIDQNLAFEGFVYGDARRNLIEGLKNRGRVDSEIDRILSNPNLSFEDMIFQLLRAVIRAGKDEATDLARELRGDRDGSRAKRDALTREINGLRGQLAGETDPARADGLRNQLNSKIEERTDAFNDSAESRAEAAESLKNAMQKISEMEQALSNILNTQHETAMAAIRNIR